LDGQNELFPKKKIGTYLQVALCASLTCEGVKTTVKTIQGII
jgi:hypothetical protein